MKILLNTKTVSTGKLDIGVLSHGEFVLRYRASGWFDDDWVNRNLSAKLTFSK